MAGDAGVGDPPGRVSLVEVCVVSASEGKRGRNGLRQGSAEQGLTLPIEVDAFSGRGTRPSAFLFLWEGMSSAAEWGRRSSSSAEVGSNF
jgi:hypothetical protein